MPDLTSARIRLEGALETVETMTTTFDVEAERLDADEVVEPAPTLELAARRGSAEAAVRRMSETAPELTLVLTRLEQARERYEQAVGRRLWLLGYQRMPTTEALRVIADEPILASQRFKDLSSLISGVEQRFVVTSKQLIIGTQAMALSEVKLVSWTEPHWVGWRSEGAVVVESHNGRRFEAPYHDVPRRFLSALRAARVPVVER